MNSEEILIIILSGALAVVVWILYCLYKGRAEIKKIQGMLGREVKRRKE